MTDKLISGTTTRINLEFCRGFSFSDALRRASWIKRRPIVDEAAPRPLDSIPKQQEGRQKKNFEAGSRPGGGGFDHRMGLASSKAPPRRGATARPEPVRL